MRREGNRNFGVWNPPSGVDNIRSSEQIDIDLISRLNSVKPDKELGVSLPIDPNQGSVEHSNQKGIDLINKMNKIGREFGGIIRQGWGGNIADSVPLFEPSPFPIPSSAVTSFPSLRLGNLRAAQIDRAMQWITCPSFCVDYYSLQTEMPAIIHRVCWQFNEWRSVPPSSTASASWNTGFATLNSWRKSFDWSVPWDTSSDYFVVDQITRNSCFPVISSTPPSTLPPRDFDASDVDLVMAVW